MQPALETPIVDILWGKVGFRSEERNLVLRTIFRNLDRRVSAQVSFL